jgi:hypothetical protein
VKLMRNWGSFNGWRGAGQSGSWIAVIVNTLVCGAVGATFGAFGNLFLWLVGGLVLGAVFGLANEALFNQARILARWYSLFISSNQELEPFMNRRLYERAGPTAQLWELPDTGHVGGIFAHPKEYKQRLISFFDAALLDQKSAAP